jgi:hypothetical protein
MAALDPAVPLSAAGYRLPYLLTTVGLGAKAGGKQQKKFLPAPVEVQGCKPQVLIFIISYL